MKVDDCQAGGEPVAVTQEHEMCSSSANSDGGHCYCWRNRTKFCCCCGSLLPFRVGDRLEIVVPTPRITGRVTAVSDGGYFTVKFDWFRPSETYPATQSTDFKLVDTHLRNATA